MEVASSRPDHKPTWKARATAIFAHQYKIPFNDWTAVGCLVLGLCDRLLPCPNNIQKDDSVEPRLGDIHVINAKKSVLMFSYNNYSYTAVFVKLNKSLVLRVN